MRPAALSPPTAYGRRRTITCWTELTITRTPSTFSNGTNFVVLPPVDAIQEFKVQTTDFSAEYGRSGAAVLNATIKSGTNSFHGAGWEFFRNDKLDAADYFERVGNTTQKGELRLNQFGVAVGGPIIKNKVFFFGDYEGLRRRQGSPHTGSVPTGPGAEQRLHRLPGDHHRTNGYTNRPARPDHADGTILDPATTRAVAGGICPRSLWHLPGQYHQLHAGGLQPEHHAG